MPLPGETTTANYGWTKPFVTGSTATWGGTLNADLDAIDAQVFAVANPAALTASSTPGTGVKGTVTFANSSAPTGQKTRWTLALDTTAEGGGNAGSNFSLQAYSDAGAAISTPLSFVRSTGAMTVGGAFNVTGAATLSGAVVMGGAVTFNGDPVINGAAASARSLFGQTASLNRWEVQVGSTTAEGGANAGSDFAIKAYSDAGAVLSTPLTIERKTGKVSVTGVSDGSDAAAGQVGEVVSSIVTSPLTMANSVGINLTSLSLPPGDWDVQGQAWFTYGASGSGGSVQADITPVSATPPLTPAMNTSRGVLYGAPFGGGTLPAISLAPCRFSGSSTMTAYLVVAGGVTSGTLTCVGMIWARRAR